MGSNVIDKTEQNTKQSQGELRFIPALFSEEDAAAYLGISKSMLRSLGMRRKKMGRRRLYVRADLDDFWQDLPYEGHEVPLQTNVDNWFATNG